MNDNPARILYDADGNAVAVQAEGNIYYLGSSDQEAHGLLGRILKELRIIRMHLASMTEESIDKGDLD